MKKKDPNVYPKGLNAKKVQAIIDYYDRQTDEEAAFEIENAPVVVESAWIKVPVKLIPQIRKLMNKRRSA